MRLLFCTVAVVLALPAGAGAANFCAPSVSPDDGCLATAAEALEAAADAPGTDEVRLGALEESLTFSDRDGGAVEIVGAGPALTRLTAPAGTVLTLEEAGSSVTGVGLTGAPGAVALRLTGAPGAQLTVTAPNGATAVRLENTSLARSVVTGGVGVDAFGPVQLSDVAVDAVGGLGSGVVTRCGAAVLRHVTVVGAAASGVRSLCVDDPSVEVDSSVIAIEPAFDLEGGAVVATAYSWFVPDGVPRSPTDSVAAAPGLDGVRLAAGSALLDQGRPDLLADRAAADPDGLPRAADGDGDGVARTDIGAYERHPLPPAPSGGNLVRDPGLEAGAAAWALSGMTRMTYGATDYPTARLAEALGAGDAFLGGGEVAQASATQVVDLRGWAPEIDAGGGTVTFAALVGGYGVDTDTGAATVTFLGPDGLALGEPVTLGTVTSADRGGATTMLHRSATGAVPPLARDAEVRLAVTRTGGTFADAFFDAVSLELQVPARPGEPNTPVTPVTPVAPGAPGPPLRPFSGLSLLSPTVKADTKGRARIEVGCASSTVRSCTGVMTATGVLVKNARAERIGLVTFSVAPGRRATLRMQLSRGAFTKLRRVARTGMRIRIYASARDGQGIARSITSPLRLRAPRR